MNQAIRYVVGDATRPDGAGNKIIVHVCNDIGGWGKGFVVALSKRWPEPEAEYRAWHEVEPLIDETLLAQGVAVTVYDFGG